MCLCVSSTDLKLAALEKLQIHIIFNSFSNGSPGTVLVREFSSALYIKVLLVCRL